MRVRANKLSLVIAACLAIAAGCGDRQPTVDLPALGNEVPEQSVPFPSQQPQNVPPQGGALLSHELSPPGRLPAVQPGPGPWPIDPVRDYSQTFSLGTPQSAAFDEGLNLWLLDKDRIGVLRPGETTAHWTRGVGQARDGFGPEALATGSTVICGGADGHAYVGYSARDLRLAIPGKAHAFIPWPGEPYYTPERFAEYQKGDLDAVRLESDGTVVLEEHLWRTLGASNKGRQAGIHNTNDFHYDEDRSVLACERVTRGAGRGDLYITTNHGVTRIRGLTYNSHRHPGWYKQVLLDDGTLDPQLQTTDMFALGIAPNGDVLVGNQQMVGILVPSPNLEDWDREQTWAGPSPWRYKGFNPALGDEEGWDFWTAFAQTSSGKYYVGSSEAGLWRLEGPLRASATWKKVPGLPTSNVLALEATDDGALYIGTGGQGLWRLEPDGETLARVEAGPGLRLTQLSYEPSTVPAMLLVISEAGLTVLRTP